MNKIVLVVKLASGFFVSLVYMLKWKETTLRTLLQV